MDARRILAALALLCLAAAPGAVLADAEADRDAGNAAWKAQDYDLAARHWRAAAEAGDRAAQNNLGFLYRKGFGVGQDEDEAARWYLRAANQGLVDAMTNLGMLYDEGFGVPMDHVESYKWFLLAHRGGHTGARAHLDILEADGFVDEAAIAEAARRADAWTATPE